jgi:hypothetical protein
MGARTGKPAPGAAKASTERGAAGSLRHRAASAGKGAGAAGKKASDALVEAVGGLADNAIDRILLADVRVTSAAEGKRLLAGGADTEALAEKIQRVVVLSVPVVRMLARGARVTRVPWVMVGSSSVSIGVSARTGVRELQVLAALMAHRLEESAGRPADPRLVKKLAIDSYLDPKRTPDLSDDRLRLVRLTRKRVLGGAFGRKTSKRAAKALDAAERLDSAAVSAQCGRQAPGGVSAPDRKPPTTTSSSMSPRRVAVLESCGEISLRHARVELAEGRARRCTAGRHERQRNRPMRKQ